MNHDSRPQSVPSIVPPRGLRLLLLSLLLIVTTTVLAILSLPGYEQWYLTFVAWTPVLLLLIWAPRRWAVLGFWLAGFLYFLGSLYWLVLVTWIGWLALALYLSLYFLVFAVMLRWLTNGRSRLPVILAAPVLWVTMEFLRSAAWTGPDWFLFTGFPWQLAGHGLYRQLTIIQVADFTGVYGVSFLVIMLNAFLAVCLRTWLTGELSRARTRWNLAVQGTVALTALTGVVVYGWVRLDEYDPVEGPRICVVQGNIPQDLGEVAMWNQLPRAELWAAIARVRARMLDTYFAVTAEAADEERDLLVWPETIVPGPIEEDAVSFEAMKRLCAESNSHVLVGTSRDAGRVGRRQWRNSAYLYTPDGEVARVYDKIHLVAFGEYLPMVERFPWLERFLPEGYVANSTPGEEMTLFELRTDDKTWRFGTPICFEDTMAYMLRRWRRRGADFVVNLTNDGWFRATREMDQHLAIVVFGAVETRMGLVRAANTGISAFIEPNGRIQRRLTDHRGRFREVSGTLVDQVMIDRRQAPYVEQEDLFAVMCLVWTVVFAGVRFGSTGVCAGSKIRRFWT